LEDANFNTFSADLLQYIDGNKIINKAALGQNFVANGCGFAISAAKNTSENGLKINLNSAEAPITSKVFDAHDEVECPACGRIFYVKNGDTTSYYSACPHCHSTKVACA
jgi:hypothetical protein